MSTYLDVLTDEWVDEEENRRHADWMTITLDGWGHVSIGRDYLRSSGERRVDPDAGVTFNVRHLDAVIDALVRLRNDLPATQRQSVEKGNE